MKHPRILIVEDDPDTARLLEIWLRSHHYQHVGTASSGRVAIAMAGSIRPELVIMDIVLPGDLDGIQTAAILLERFDIPALYLTAFTEDELFERARETAPSAYLTKPFNDRELKRAVEVALDRHALLRRLKASEAHLAEAQAVAHIGSWRWHLTRDQVEASNELLRLLEMTPGTFEPRFDSFLQRVSVDDQPSVLQTIETLLTGGDPGEFEVSIPRANGQQRRLRVCCTAHFDADGKAFELVGTARDVTHEWTARQEADLYRNQLEEKVAQRTADLDATNLRLQNEIAEHLKTEKHLRQSEARSRSILRAAPVGIGVVVDRVLLEINEAMTTMSGYGPEELLGQSTRMLYPTQADFDYVGTEKYQQMRERGIGSVETRWRRKDGRIIDVALSSSPVVADDLSQGVTFTAQDITATKRAEQERLTHETLQRNVLVREVHHRIKNNLQGVIGLLRQHISDHPDTQPTIEAAIAQINTVAVVHGLQSRMPQHELRLRELVQEVSGAAAALAMVSQRPAIDDTLSGDVWLDSNAAVSIALILNELIHNALKHRHHTDGMGVNIALSGDTQRVTVHIGNPGGPLPANLDLSTGQGCGTGLDLVRTLLPRRGAELDLYEGDGRITAEFVLSPPVTSTHGHAVRTPNRPMK